MESGEIASSFNDRAGNPPKRTSELSRGMSALCQKQTFCTAVKPPLFDHLVGAGEQRAVINFYIRPSAIVSQSTL